MFSFCLSVNDEGNAILNLKMASPLPPPFLGIPAPATLTSAPGETILFSSSTTGSPSTPFLVCVNPHNACFNDIISSVTRLSPSRFQTSSGFSSITNLR